VSQNQYLFWVNLFPFPEKRNRRQGIVDHFFLHGDGRAHHLGAMDQGTLVISQNGNAS
jgi:hypothetical protein